MSHFIKKNRALIIFAIVILMFSGSFSLYTYSKAQEKIDLSSVYESFLKYKFSSLDKNIFEKTSEKTYIVEWENGQVPFYIQLFDNAFGSPPSSKYYSPASIPDSAKAIQVDVKLAGTYGTDANVFLMFYNDNTRLKNGVKTIQLRNPRNKDKSHTNKIESFSFKSNILPKYKYFKIAIKLNPEKSGKGFFRMEDLDIIFK
ncbi:hypothetical protein LQV63_08685 [Paenibacillus profundus]|uniref:Uncharacterized protein n=1 Tax=Paenibacillus profundus TaxID=1173085 RepID=A0ABS8YGW7_9BACL|nr:hypothetical protein [Paenibacillus profundus]MCE5169387.1 hypothetical protein [Paenibacillus profundus]